MRDARYTHRYIHTGPNELPDPTLVRERLYQLEVFPNNTAPTSSVCTLLDHLPWSAKQSANQTKDTATDIQFQLTLILIHLYTDFFQ